MSELNLPGVTLDPRDERELEAAFGVTSNAEELIKANRARVSPEHRKVLRLDENAGATDSLYELDEDGNRLFLKDDLAKFLDHPVESARVRGRGRNAVISYVYVGDRQSYEKGYVSYADVFGSSADRRAAQRSAAPVDPSQAAQAAADTKLTEAETKAAEALQKAQDEARKLVEQAREEVSKLVAEATAEANRIRQEAAEAAPAAAADAEEEAKAAAASGNRPAPRAARTRGGSSS